MEVLITSHEVFLGIKCNSYIHVARNAKVTSAKMFLRKLQRNGRKNFRGVFSTHSNIYDEAFLRK